MKIQQWLLLLISTLFILSACDDPVPVEDTGYEALAPPTEIKQNNLFTVEFYSQLNDNSLFEDNNYQSVVDHIAANNAPLAFFFERSDAVIGETSPAVQIAWETKTKSFFVQNNGSTTIVQGTGMIVRPLVNAFEGVGIPDSLFLAGCVLSAPLGQPVVLNLMTCKLIEKYQLPLLTNTLNDEWATNNKILIGSIKHSLVAEMQSYLKKNMKDFRLSFFNASTDKSYQLFILTPVNFVNREVKTATVGNTPMYECKIEYLN